jgi:hypothetical protein
MTLKAVPKPEGHDLRAARVEKVDNTKWLPEDALYSAYEEISKAKVERALVCAWWEKDENGEMHMNFRSYSEHPQQVTALVAVLFGYMTAP